MRTEFVVALHSPVGDDPTDALVDFLLAAVDELAAETDVEATADMLAVTHACKDAHGGSVWGFAVEMPEEVGPAGQVLDAFTAALRDSEDVRHVSRFEDDALREEMRARADQIFEVEMKARRALTFAYLRASVGDRPYEMLREDAEKAQKDMDEAGMRARGENPLFHLGFPQYAKLNVRKKVDMESLVAALRNADDYDALRTELSRTPLERDEDKSLIAGLQQSVDVLEKIRNAVAHNRRLGQTLLGNLPNALAAAHGHLDAYLEELEHDAQSLEAEQN